MKTNTPAPKRGLFQWELARTIGQRSRDLLEGAEPWIEIGDVDDSEMIAKLELAARCCPVLLWIEELHAFVNPNDMVTEANIEFLRLTALSDWPDKLRRH